MKNSIEEIWKVGFLNEKSLVAPKINDLYNQKSKHVVERVKRMFRVNLAIIVIMSIAIPVFYYFLDALWQGVGATILLLSTAWYGNRQIHSIKILDQGATSLDYLKSFDRWLKDIFSTTGKMVRFTYPLYFLLAISTVWSTWNKNVEPSLTIHQTFPDSIFVGNIPLFAVVILGIATVLMFYFSDRIYKWDVHLMYGRLFGKLEETIAEMEKLKQD